MGGRPKALATRESNPASFSSDDLGDNLRNVPRMQPEMGKQLAAAAQQGKNPTVTDHGIFGKPVNAGTITDSQPFESVDDRINDTNKESNGAKLTVTDKEDLNSNSEASAEQLLDEGGQAVVRSGPNTTRPKSTWVRIKRMNCGSSLHEKPSNSTTLGKRGNMQSEESITCGDDEVQNFKRGKMEAQASSDGQISAGVVDHPCWKQ